MMGKEPLCGGRDRSLEAVVSPLSRGPSKGIPAQCTSLLAALSGMAADKPEEEKRALGT